MRLLDLQISVSRQLEDLPYPAYLLSMSVIGRQLQETYADLLPGDGDLLARQTVDAVKAAYLSGEAARDEAWQLHRRWEELIEDPATDGPLGMFSAMYVFDMLACEMAGEIKQQAAIGQVTNAAKAPDQEADKPLGPQLVRIDPGRQADESSPTVQLIRKFEEAARLAARQHNTGQRCDPDQFHSAGIRLTQSVARPIMALRQWRSCMRSAPSLAAGRAPSSGGEDAPQAGPVGFQKSTTRPDLGFYAVRSYSLVRPPRTGWRLIRSWRGRRQGGRAGAGGARGCDGAAVRCSGPRTRSGSSVDAARRRSVSGQ